MNAYCKNNPITCVDPTGTITLYQAQQSLVNSTGWHGYSLSDIILAYKMGYGSSDEAPFLTAKASVAPYTSIIFGSIKTTSYNGWKIRIDSANTNTNTQKHIHIQGFKKEYAQNIDGSPHDGSKGSPPNSVKKYLKKQGYWDWDANQRKYDESHIDLNEYYNSMKTLYDNNGTTVVMPIDPSMNGVPVAPGYFPGFGYNPGIIY